MAEPRARELRLFDTHCHLGFGGEEAPDERAVRQRARALGVVALVDVGIDVASSEACVARAAPEDGVYASAGLHPNSCANWRAELPAIRALALDARCHAVGETGLDLYWDEVPLDVQRASLLAHVALAREAQKTLILHCRDAFDELFECLEAHAPLHGILHCFTGDAQQAKRCVELGLRVSFAGPLTYPRNDELRRAAEALPLDRILLETDAPFLPPQSMRGKRNEPAAVREVAECMARVRELPLEELAEACTRNAFDQFGLAAG